MFGSCSVFSMKVLLMGISVALGGLSALDDEAALLMTSLMRNLLGVPMVLALLTGGLLIKAMNALDDAICNGVCSSVVCTLLNSNL